MEAPNASLPCRRAVALAVALGALALLAAGCGALGYTAAGGDKTNGKKLFVNGAHGKPACGSCHTLADAGTKGTIGPNLDDAFKQALADGETRDTVRQVVRAQIAYAITTTSTGAPGMPRNLVTGKDADDVASYVASVAASGAAAAPPPPATSTPAATTPTPPSGGGGGSSAQLAAGKKVFLDNACGGCHTLKEAGSGGNVGPDLDHLAADAQKAGQPLAAYVKQSVVDPNAYVVPGFPKNTMPGTFGQTLSKAQLADLVAFLVAAASGP